MSIARTSRSLCASSSGMIASVCFFIAGQVSPSDDCTGSRFVAFLPRLLPFLLLQQCPFDGLGGSFVCVLIRRPRGSPGIPYGGSEPCAAFGVGSRTDTSPLKGCCTATLVSLRLPLKAQGLRKPK
jgi:hypothetical protein